MASKEVAVKKYVARLSEEERARLEEFIRRQARRAFVDESPHSVEIGRV